MQAPLYSHILDPVSIKKKHSALPVTAAISANMHMPLNTIAGRSTSALRLSQQSTAPNPETTANRLARIVTPQLRRRFLFARHHIYVYYNDIASQFKSCYPDGAGLYVDRYCQNTHSLRAGTWHAMSSSNPDIEQRHRRSGKRRHTATQISRSTAGSFL